MKCSMKKADSRQHTKKGRAKRRGDTDKCRGQVGKKGQTTGERGLMATNIREEMGD